MGDSGGEGDMTIKGLKPCPFCGKCEQVEFKQMWEATGFEDSNTYTYHIRCDYCGALGPESGKSFHQAREEWEGRKPWLSSEQK